MNADEYRMNLNDYVSAPRTFAAHLFDVFTAGLTATEMQTRVKARFNDPDRREQCLAEVENLIVAGVLEHVTVGNSRIIRKGGAA
ncbi:hypothetical protein KUG88_18905 [Rhodococcus rhodochrous]|uniref:hypothetical protein n=1 Tax=Rhodococcus rhodochrous TaxID=1829 RepID=UPI001E29957F|nr:hypothetical protein [Rhodococcus rhodochrous]MCB8912199.1 hypothetical protein [Rhodococcus rhodochrous]